MSTCKLSFLRRSYISVTVHPIVGTKPVRPSACFFISVGYQSIFSRLNYVLWVQDIVKTFVLGDEVEVVRGIDVCAFTSLATFDLLTHEAAEPEPLPYILCWHVAWNQSGPLLLPVSVSRLFSPAGAYPYSRYRQGVPCISSAECRAKWPF